MCRSPVISGIKILRMYPRAKLWNGLPSPATSRSIPVVSPHLAPCHNQFLWHCAPTLHISYFPVCFYVSVWFVWALIAGTLGLGRWAGVWFLFTHQACPAGGCWMLPLLFLLPLSLGCACMAALRCCSMPLPSFLLLSSVCQSSNARQAEGEQKVPAWESCV